MFSLVGFKEHCDTTLHFIQQATSLLTEVEVEDFVVAVIVAIVIAITIAVMLINFCDKVLSLSCDDGFLHGFEVSSGSMRQPLLVLAFWLCQKEESSFFSRFVDWQFFLNHYLSLFELKEIVVFSALELLMQVVF